MIEAKIDTSAAEKQLRTVAARIGDRRTVNRKVAAQLQGWVLRNFKAEGGLAEAGWAPLAPSTVKAKARKGYARILQNTGALRQSFLPFSDNDEAGVGAVQLKGRDAPVDLARIHQEGAPAANIPARPMLPTMRQALPLAMQIYQLHLERALGQPA